MAHVPKPASEDMLPKPPESDQVRATRELDVEEAIPQEETPEEETPEEVDPPSTSDDELPEIKRRLGVLGPLPFPRGLSCFGV